MFTKELEARLVDLAALAMRENGKYPEELNDFIGSLPAKNAQSEIKAEIDGLLATVEVTEERVTYLKRADRTAQKDGLNIVFNRDGTLEVNEAIPFDGSKPENEVEEQE